MADDEEQIQVPYAPDFTPATLGKEMGEDRVLAWLLGVAKPHPLRAEYLEEIKSKGLAHVGGAKADNNRRDMANHVITGLIGYGLLAQDGDHLHLTEVGDSLNEAPHEDRPAAFARHILTRCNGQRVVDAILEYELRGEKPALEDLANRFDRNSTAKSVSTMRAWLAQAGVFQGKSYKIDHSALDDIMGAGAGQLMDLDPSGLEFLIAARILEQQNGSTDLSAPEVATFTEARSDVKIRRKSLNVFLEGLAKKGLLERERVSGQAGGTKNHIQLTDQARMFAEEELRGLLDQSQGFRLADLRPLHQLLSDLDAGTAEQRGHVGEELAAHLCLMLGLRVVAWRKRAPAAEIDLIAERTAALTYQRWDVQVKNTSGDLDADRVDRELGATMGTGITHVLFVVPRAGLTSNASIQVRKKSELTSQTLLTLTKPDIGEPPSAIQMLKSLRIQARHLSSLKAKEAERREA